MASVPVDPILEKFKQHFLPFQATQGLDFDALDADPEARKLILTKLEEIAATSKPNFLIGYSGHTNSTISLATSLNIACGTAYKNPINDNPDDFNIYYNKQFLLTRQAQLGEPLRLIYLDDYIETGHAAKKLIQLLRSDGFKIDDAIVLLEFKDTGAAEALAGMNTKLHSLVRYSFEDGFIPGINGANAEAFVRKQNAGSSLGTPGEAPVSQKFMRVSQEISAFPNPRHTQSHAYRSARAQQMLVI